MSQSYAMWKLQPRIVHLYGPWRCRTVVAVWLVFAQKCCDRSIFNLLPRTHNTIVLQRIVNVVTMTKTARRDWSAGMMRTIPAIYPPAALEPHSPARNIAQTRERRHTSSPRYSKTGSVWTHAWGTGKSTDIDHCLIDINNAHASLSFTMLAKWPLRLYF